MEIQDVRLVYAPAAGIGNFGGETDNWQWPRHTGDFCFYRAYVSPAGKAVPFAKENVPFRPKHFLRVSTKGANPGELVFVAGYPGRTFRLNTYADVKETVDFTLPRVVKRYAEQIALLEKLSKEDKETALRVSTRLRGFNNTLTKDKGVLEGMVKGGLLAQKEANEKELVRWIDADPARKAAYGDVLPALNALVVEKARTRERDALLLELQGGTGPVPFTALALGAAAHPLLGGEAEAGRGPGPGLPAAELDPRPRGAGAGAAEPRSEGRPHPDDLHAHRRREAAGGAADRGRRQGGRA